MSPRRSRKFAQPSAAPSIVARLLRFTIPLAISFIPTIGMFPSASPGSLSPYCVLARTAPAGTTFQPGGNSLLNKEAVKVLSGIDTKLLQAASHLRPHIGKLRFDPVDLLLQGGDVDIFLGFEGVDVSRNVEVELVARDLF